VTGGVSGTGFDQDLDALALAQRANGIGKTE